MNNNMKCIVAIASLQTLSYIFAISGIIIAIRYNFIAGLSIVISSTVFNGYACILEKVNTL